MNHLGGHKDWPKKDCSVCRPDTRPPEAPVEAELSNGEKMSRALRAASERMKARRS